MTNKVPYHQNWSTILSTSFCSLLSPLLSLALKYPTGRPSFTFPPSCIFQLYMYYFLSLYIMIYLDHVAEHIHQVDKLLESIKLYRNSSAQSAHIRVVTLQDGAHQGQAAVLHQHSAVPAWE